MKQGALAPCFIPVAKVLEILVNNQHYLETNHGKT